MNRPWIRAALVLVIFAAVYLALAIGCYRLESATYDEPQHLVPGYTALKLRDYRLDPEHPPLLRMWAALPLLVLPNIKVATNSQYWVNAEPYQFCHEFLFQDNDADSLLFRARFMIALLGVLLGVLVFCWARELFGFWPAVIVLGFYCTEPNLLAHSGLVTTDLGSTCLVFGATYFAWRLAGEFSAGNLSGFAVFFVLAQISKYSAVLWGLVLFALLLLRALRATPWRLRFRQPKLLSARTSKVLLALFVMSALLLASYAALWGVYAFRYAPTPASGQERFSMTDQAQRHLPQLMRLMQWIDDHHLLPNASAQGFASMATTTQGRAGYLLGKFSNDGWWYYFPLAILIKTPLALLLAALAGFVLCIVHRRARGHDTLFVLVPPAVYLATAMAGHLNIGLRHVLPVYPFVVLAAGWTIVALFPRPPSRGGRSRGRILVLAALCLAQVTEFAATYPYCLAFFNISIGGPRHGAEYLVDSNLDWGQGLKLLKRWMTEHHVRHINLSYFGIADPAYYGIEYTPLPGAPFFDRQRITQPQLPGYVAISATYLRGAYLSDFERSLYAPLRERKPVAVLGHCLYVYWMERPWW